MIRVILSLLIMLSVVACGTIAAPVARGSAQDQAASATAAATDKRTAADNAQTAAAKSDAVAIIAEKTAQTNPTPETIANAAKLRADAMVAQAIAKALADQAEHAERAATLAADRARIERAADAEQAAKLADEERTDRDRRWAVIGLALCAAAGIALRVLGIPSLVSIGIPAALAGGCLVLIAWTSVPWLAVVIGWVFAAIVLTVLVFVVRTVIMEWLRYADHLDAAMPSAKQDADDASRALQSPWMRWILDHLLRRFGG